MIKYDKSKSLTNDKSLVGSKAKKTHLERKAQPKNQQFQIDLSKKSLDTDPKFKKTRNQLEVDAQTDKQSKAQASSSQSSTTHKQLQTKSLNNSQLEDSLLQKSPLTTVRDQEELISQSLTVKKQMSPGIMGGRLTIKSITNIDSRVNKSFLQEANEDQRQNNQGYQQQQELMLNDNSFPLSNKNMQQIDTSKTQTPFHSSPIRAFQSEIILNEQSNEKLRVPVILRKPPIDPHAQMNYITAQSDAVPSHNYNSSHSNQQRYKDLVQKGKIINKERDSLILRQIKEPDCNEGMGLVQQLISSQNPSFLNQEDQKIDITPITNRQAAVLLIDRNSRMSEITMLDDIEECPPLSPTGSGGDSGTNGLRLPLTRIQGDNRFSIRQIQLNLISSLMGTYNRTSFITRASNKLQKNYSSNSSSQRKSQCSHRCSSKGFKTLFNCCTNYNGSASVTGANVATSRAKNDNNSVYSNNSGYNKIVTHNNGSSFIQKHVRTEDFSDEVDEYENDSMNHRMSLVKRKNVNQFNALQPGIKIRETSKVVHPLQQIPNHNNAQQQQENQQQENQQQQQQQSKRNGGGNKLSSLVTKMPMNGIPNNIQQQNTQQQPTNQFIDIQSIQVNLNSTGNSNTFNVTQQLTSNNVQQKTVVNLVNNNTQQQEDSLTNSSGVLPQDIHRLHFLQTIQALHTIKNNITMPEERQIQHLKVRLPDDPKKRKTLIFDMDETLIHCVDDIENEDPDVIIPIDFPDEEELVNAGVNIRPYIYECLEEANKHFQVIIFTASHKAYADAILDYVDPENKYFAYRLYRDNCVQTKEGYYVKDLRILENRDLRDVVIIDNSVFSFAFQIDNGIPIIPFYADKEDEEMLHLIYYLNCLTNVEDVREQNREAFELRKLQDQTPMEIINNYYTTNNQNQLLLQNDDDGLNNEGDVILEENEDTQEVLSEGSNYYNNDGYETFSQQQQQHSQNNVGYNQQQQQNPKQYLKLVS